MGISKEQIAEAWKSWLIEDTNTIEDGTYRKTASGVIMFYDAASDEWVPVSAPYDGAPDRDGRFSRMEETPEPSGHDWTEGNNTWSKQYPGTLRSELKEWCWSIADGWGETDAMRIAGLKWIEDTDWKDGQVTCNNCFMYTQADRMTCQDCGKPLAQEVKTQ